MSKRTSQEATNVQLPVIQLALDKIKVDESKNLRRFNPDAKAIQDLAQDIKKNKMLSPVLVRVLNGDGEYELVAGFQRMKAIQYLNDNGETIGAVSASVVEIDADEVPEAPAEGTEAPKTVSASAIRSKLLNLAENMRRNELSYIDAAYGIKDLMDAGMTAGDVAKEFKKSGAWVSYTRKFLDLRPEVQKRIHEGKINFRLARTLIDLTEEEQDAAITQADAGDLGGAGATAGKAKRAKGKKNKRGRAAREDQTEGRNLSSKQAILLLEGQVKELADAEGKRTKAEENAIDLYSNIIKYLTGAFGMKGLHNRVMKVL